MSLVHRSAAYLAALTAVFAIAFALLAAQPAQKSEADVGTLAASPTISADAFNTIIVADIDIDEGTDFVVATVNLASSGSAVFAASGTTSLVCFNNATCDTGDDTDLTIEIRVNGTGTAGAVVVNIALTDGTDGLDGEQPDGDTGSIGWTQTAPAATIKILATTTAVPVKAVVADDQAVLSGVVLTSTGGAVKPGTVITWQAVGVGVFQDTIAMAQVVSGTAPLKGGAYDNATTENSGCSDGDGLQSCTSATETQDDGETVATAEPEGTGVASVTFEGAGVPGTTVITARVGTSISASRTINIFGPLASIELARSGSIEFIRNNATGKADLVMTGTDAAGVPVGGFRPTFSVITPGRGAGPVKLTSVENGSIPACGDGTSVATGRCNIGVEASTTLGVNTIRVANGTGTITAEITVTVVGAPANIEIIDAPTSVAPLSNTPLTIRITTAEGDPAPDGSIPLVLATGTGVIVIPPGFSTVGGDVLATVVAGNIDGIINVLVFLGALQDEVNINVTGAVDTGGGGGGGGGGEGFTGEFPTSGFATVTFTGSIAEMDTSLETACSNGAPVFGSQVVAGVGTLIPYFSTTSLSAPNAAFEAAFADGLDNAALIVGNCA